MARSPWRSERGQATLEWTALVAVVAAVLALAGAVAGGPGIVNAVGGALQRALCLVGGGTCRPAEPEACVLSSSDSSLQAGMKLTFVKLGGRVGLLREERSDGTFLLTLVDDVEAGLTAGAGVRAEVQLADLLHARVGGMSQAEVIARLGRRRSWTVSSEEQADALERRIVRSVAERMVARPLLDAVSELTGVDLAELPEPDESSLGGELEASGSGRLDLGVRARAGLRATLGATRGRDGTTRVTFALAGEASVDLQRALFGLHAEGLASVAVTVSFDRRGRATELRAAAVADGDGQAALPQGTPRAVAGRAGGGGRVEATATLDLTVSDHAEAVERVLAALAPDRAGDLPAAAGELARRLSSSGTLSAERRTMSRDAYGTELGVGLGPEAGLAVEASRVASQLEDAWWRPPGGVWDRRLDCMGDRA